MGAISREAKLAARLLDAVAQHIERAAPLDFGGNAHLPGAGFDDARWSAQCHDVTAYPAMNLLAASCSTHSIVVDISNPEKPYRVDALTDTNNFQGRQTAPFSNDGKQLIQTDEWGGGTGPMCQASSMIELGGNTVITLDEKKKQTQRGYFKLPSAQAAEENCVSQSATGIGFSDRGSINPPKLIDGPRPPAGTPEVRGGGNTISGSWGAYYWNGLIFSSELDRGMDILELTPSAQLSANEIATAKLVQFNEYNPQSQPKMTWPPAFVVVRSYLDQLVRDAGLASDRTSAISAALDVAEMKTGSARASALNDLAKQVDKDVAGAKDGARVRTMAGEIRRLAAASR